MLLAYCPMPDHYHLVVRPQDGSFSTRMQRMLISSAKTVNAKSDRVGALFQGQFQAVAIENDKRLVSLTVYLHNNLVLGRLVPRAEGRECSSCPEYLGPQRGTLPAPELALDLCGGRRCTTDGSHRSMRSSIRIPSISS